MDSNVIVRLSRLDELEKLIERGFETFIQIGNAIAEIHENKLYLDRGYSNFADYMKRRWGWSRDYGYKQIRCARIAGFLSDNVDGRLHLPPPTAEFQVRHLARLGKDAEEAWLSAWENAVYLANDGLEPEQWSPPREADVRAVVDEILSPARERKLLDMRELGKFNIIYCDPPWQYDYSFSDSRAIERHYPTMDMSDLFALAHQVKDIAADNSLIFMWCPPAFTRKAIILMRVWGFDFRTNIVWVKPSIGPGQWVRQQHELLMIGRRGNIMTPDGSLRPASVIEAGRGEHSEKPKCVYSIIEQMYPDMPRIEIFARQESEGWISWGNQIIE